METQEFLQFPVKDSEVPSVFKRADRNKHKEFVLLTTHQWELTILQSASSQHIRRLAWWSGSTEGGVLMGSTSQFSSDSYKALMNSPTNDISLEMAKWEKLPPRAVHCC